MIKRFLVFLAVLFALSTSQGFAQSPPSGVTKPPRPRSVPTRPAEPCSPRDFVQAADTGTNSICDGLTLTWLDLGSGGGGGGAPTTATYITQTPNASLSAEQALSALATGLVKNTTATGVLSIAIAADLPSGIDAAKVGGGGVSTAEFDFLGGVTSDVQTQLNAKQATLTFGTGVQTALGVNVGSAGAPVLFNGAGGTPSSMTGTNISGTAAGLTAGTVTTNANLAGVVISSGSNTTTPGKVDVMQTSLYCSDAGANDTYTCSLSPAATAYVTGTTYRFKANTANTGAASINFNSVGALTIVKVQGAITTTLADNDIRVGQWVTCTYDGTNCQMISQLGNAASGGTPGGSDTQLQRNNAGALGGITNATSDGTTLTMTSPKLITALLDTNGNELFNVTATGSAVNEFTIANAATGASPTLSATGGSTDIDIKFTPKGVGGVVAVSGTKANPAYRFTVADSNTGIYSRTSGIVDIAAGGNLVADITGSAIQFNSAVNLAWSSSSPDAAAVDTGLTRVSAGLVEINNGTPGTLRDLTLRTLISTGTVQTGVGSGVAGAWQCTEGSAATPDANSAVLYCPADVTTAYGIKLPAAAATGIGHYSNSSNVVTMSISAVDLASADVTGILPAANGGTGINNSTRTLTVSTNAGTLAFGSAASTQTFQASDTILGRATTDTLTNKTYDASATGNVLTSTFQPWFGASGCNNATASSFWDLGTSLAPTPTCKNSSSGNAQNASLDFPDSDGMYFAQANFQLPSDFSGTVDANIKWMAAATSGDVIWNVSTICVADGETDAPAFNTASSVTDTAKGTTLQTNDASITGVTITGCAAGELMHLKISRDRTTSGDTITGVVSFLGLRLTTTRAQ